MYSDVSVVVDERSKERGQVGESFCKSCRDEWRTLKADTNRTKRRWRLSLLEHDNNILANVWSWSTTTSSHHHMSLDFISDTRLSVTWLFFFWYGNLFKRFCYLCIFQVCKNQINAHCLFFVVVVKHNCLKCVTLLLIKSSVIWWILFHDSYSRLKSKTAEWIA